MEKRKIQISKTSFLFLTTLSQKIDWDCPRKFISQYRTKNVLSKEVIRDEKTNAKIKKEKCLYTENVLMINIKDLRQKLHRNSDDDDEKVLVLEFTAESELSGKTQTKTLIYSLDDIKDEEFEIGNFFYFFKEPKSICSRIAQKCTPFFTQIIRVVLVPILFGIGTHKAKGERKRNAQ